MKVITEEMIPLIEHQEDDNEFPFKNHGLAEILKKYLVEIDQITVSKLRPMSDAHKSVDLDENSVKVLAMHRMEKQFIPVIVFDDGDVIGLCESFDVDEFDGWIPMPVYKPEQS